MSRIKNNQVSVWQKFTIDYTDVVTGNEALGEGSVNITTILAGHYIEAVAINIPPGETWNDPGDGVEITLNLTFGPNLLPAYSIEGVDDFYNSINQADIDTAIPNARVHEQNRTLSATVKVDMYVAHTMSEITSGSIDIYIKTLSLT